MRVLLTGGAYQSQSIIANAQRCVNLYPERNPPEDEAPVPVTHYQTPGLTLLGTPPIVAPARGAYRASNGNLYYVVGNMLYYVSPAWAFTALGTIAAGPNPVSMSDNGTDLVLVDGSPNGYTVALATQTFAKIDDPNFLGADRVDYLDTFLLLNQPGTANFYISQSNVVTFDGTDVVSKSSFPDPLSVAIELHGEVWLLGTLTSEVWYNAGGALFPFQIFPGILIEHGCVAKFSAAKQDVSVFWLSQDQQGQAIVLEGIGYQVRRISTHAIENTLSGYGTISDAIGFIYQQDGHVFYVLTFPSADATWVYDKATSLWHERVWLDPNGNPHRHRANCCASAYGKIVVGDWQNGTLYALDTNAYTDNGNPIARIRSFPHMLDDSRRVFYAEFVADMDVGEDTVATDQPTVSLRWSDSKGARWGNAVQQSLGATGQYLTNIQWRRLGMARDRVFELSWSVNAKTALNGAFIETMSAET